MSILLSVESPLDDLSSQAWRGKVTIRAAWESPGWHYLRTAAAVLLREAGF